MEWFQKEITLAPKARGFHLVTREVLQMVPELQQFRVGIAHLFIQHTSASLGINENADPTVRRDMESHFNEMVPEHAPYYVHTTEGPDDMPAHIKSVLTATSLSIPIDQGRLALGIWQGIYLWEHRHHGGRRNLVVHISE